MIHRLSQTKERLSNLVGFDTTSAYSNLGIIEWIEAQVAPLGARIERLPNSEGDKANLWIRFGPDADGGVLLSGHTDVVPVAGQDWATDPFTLTERNGRLYGRGACDMKGFIALCLAYAEDFADEAIGQPVHFAFSYDEEVGCLGAPDMIHDIAKRGPRPSAAIIGEPTEWGVVSAHKSIDTFFVTVTGREAHSSRTDLGVSAIQEAARFISALNDLGDQARTRVPKDSDFAPPETTLTVGTIAGGEAANILAKTCRFQFDIRVPSTDDRDFYLQAVTSLADEADARIKARAPEGGFNLTHRSGAPGLAPETAGAAEALARAITGDNETRVAPFATEAGQFQTYGGFSTIVCGPGSIAQAHQPNEYLEVAQLARGVEVFDRLLARLKA